MSKSCEFLLEIGTEEMPSAPLIHATKQLAQLMQAHLQKSGLTFGSVEAHQSPRRLAVLVHDLAAQTPEINEIKRGPAASIAFDANKQPTKAALGFAKKCGVDAHDLIEKTAEDGKNYVFAQKFIAARTAQELLGDMCHDIVASLEWPNYRSQRWAFETESFVRPVRWLVALLDEEVIPFSYAGVSSSCTTQGHRVLGHGSHTIDCPGNYRSILRDAGVLLEDERRQKILDEVAAFEHTHPQLHVDMPKKTFEEVINLCEYPRVLIGSFDQEFLDVPHEIICESMLTNQRYFPIYTKDGELTRDFVIVSNGAASADKAIIDGNERVVRARLDDAKFFFEEDLKHPLDEYVPRLSKVVFQEKLGSVLDKTNRMTRLILVCAELLKADDAVAKLCERAAYLAKADLVTNAVVEFTSQQGVMGGYYARAMGEDPRVCKAIAQHYRPRFSKDATPDDFVGKLVALVDKLDTICGMFAINEPPTGSSDPFAQRRSALGIIAILQELPSCSLKALINAALNLFKEQGLDFDASAVSTCVSEFFSVRLQALAKEQSVSPESISAIAAIGIIDPREFFARVQAFDSARASEPQLFEDLAIAYARASHLTDAALGTDVNVSMLTPAELQLFTACSNGRDNVEKALSNGEYARALASLAELREPIDQFFNDVRIMDDDTEIRNNRFRLLNTFTSVFSKVADIAALTKKK